MKEYVFRIVVRDPEAPLREGVVFEFGTPTTDATAFTSAIEAFAAMLRINGTPEKTVRFIEQNKEAARLKKLITGS